jgi:hypothetical protein
MVIPTLSRIINELIGKCADTSKFEAADLNEMAQTNARHFYNISKRQWRDEGLARDELHRFLRKSNPQWFRSLEQHHIEKAVKRQKVALISLLAPRTVTN